MTLEFAAARENMVENQVRTNDVTDFGVQDAMRLVRRERLCPPTRLHLAYAEAPVEYAPGYYLMEPRDVAKLLQGLRPRPGERALAIAAPYGAAVLSAIGLKTALRLPLGVEPVDLVAHLAEDGVPTVPGDLAAVDENGPYDVILVEGAVDLVPEAWTDMLHLGGRLGVVERRGPVGRARLYTRSLDGVLSARTLFDATPPMLPGFAPVPAFQF
jgi:protein-L-isoaspartate(D-aspartate) O-methyltransferase